MFLHHKIFIKCLVLGTMNSEMINQFYSFTLIWEASSLGIYINEIRGNKHIPLTRICYWPASDAWSQILIELEAKKWISQEEKKFLLDKTVDIIDVFLEKQFKKSVKSIGRPEANCPMETTLKLIDGLNLDCPIELLIIDKEGLITHCPGGL